MKYATKKELVHAAKLAAADIDAAETKAQIIGAFKKHVPALGYKTLAKLLLGMDAEAAVKKWADHIDEDEGNPVK